MSQALSSVAAVCAVAALIFSLTSQASQIDQIQASRRASAADACRLLRRIIVVAGVRHPQLTRAFVRREGLNDCIKYASAHVQ